ncbi:MAG: GNAT family N-acetyltransferase [Proteobacteria bacterium]|nr:GNAT family N-acetyltransferase [Pseudomonadota bacterium]
MTNTEFTLRLGTHADFDSLYAIYMHGSVNPYLNFEIMDKKSFEPIFNELRQSGDLYVYEHDKKIVATCIAMRLKRRAQHVATLGTLATHPNFQGKGIGSQFIQKIITLLKEQGIKRIDLFAEADNLKAIHFYKKMGFELEGVLKKYFLRENENKYIDEHLMALIVN